MNITLQKKDTNNIFILSFYFFLLILVGSLEGQLHLTDVISRILLGGYLFFSVIFFQIWKKSSRFIPFYDLPFRILSIFCLYAGIEGVIRSDSLVIMHAIGLFVIFYFIYANVITLSSRQIDTLSRKLGYIVFLYVILNILFLIFYPERMWGGGVLDIHSDHPFIGFLSTPNSNADVLFISSIILFLALLASIKKVDKLIFLGSIVILFVLIILSESRSVIFSVLFLISMMILYFLFKNYRQISLYLKIFLLLAVGLLVSFVIFKFRSIHPNAHLFSDSLMGRQGIWHDTIQYIIIHHQYIFGVGLGKQNIVILASHYPYFQAHNTFIDIFIGTGLIGLFLFLLYFAIIFFTLIKYLISHFDAKAFFILMAAIAITMHSLVESYLINQLSPDLYCFILLYAIAKCIHSDFEEGSSKQVTFNF